MQKSNNSTPTASAPHITLAALVAAVLVCVPYSSSTAGEDWKAATHWGTLKFQGSLALPLGENEVEAWNRCEVPLLDLLDFYGRIKVNTTGGVLAAFEYVFARKVGIELSFIYWAEVVEIEFEATDFDVKGTPNFTFPTIGGNYHFTPGKNLDLYAGGLIALGVIATGWPADNIEIGKDVALGLNLAADYYFGKSWSMGASLKYIDFGEVDFSVFPPGFEGLICNNGLIGLGHLNLITFNLGVGYRFL